MLPIIRQKVSLSLVKKRNSHFDVIAKTPRQKVHLSTSLSNNRLETDFRTRLLCSLAAAAQPLR
jgi:hypothetical protein